METIICAAIHYDDGVEYRYQKCYGITTGFVIGVFRHPMANDILFLNPKFNGECLVRCGEYKVTQGFITSMGRFVGRNEAYGIAVAAKQIEGDSESGRRLFSEDLYPKQFYNQNGEPIK